MKKGLLLIILIGLYYSYNGVQFETFPLNSYFKGGNNLSLHGDNELYRYFDITDTIIARFEIPEVDSTDYVVFHTGFALLYNDEHKQARWVAYELDQEKMAVKHERSGNFKKDPKVLSGTATNSDYKSSNYDRGHLAPAADMAWSLEAMEESFYYSNISPQEPGFNRGIWKKLESLVRKWANENEAIYVVTGPILIDSLKTIGGNCVSVPECFYKVILDYREPILKGIAFIIPNEASRKSLQSFAVTIDSVEKVTGINFFPLLTKEEETLEKELCIECWTWF